MLFLNNKNIIKNKILLEYMKYNIKNKKYNEILIKEEEEETKFIENFNEIKYRLSENDIKNIHDWSSYKKKIKFSSTIKKTFKKKPISVNKKWYIAMSDFIKRSNNIFWSYENTKNFNKIQAIQDKFEKMNLKKILNLNNKNYFNKPKTIFVTIDLIRLKTIITVNSFKKQLLILSNGLVFKKMNLNHKKYKKSVKITFLNIKTVLVKLNFVKKFGIAYFNIKGLSSPINTVISYIDKNIKKNNDYTKIIFISNHKKSKNTKFKFKRVKAIKRKLKKKFVKLK